MLYSGSCPSISRFTASYFLYNTLDWFLSAEYLLDELQLPRVNVSPTRHNGLAEVDVDVGDLVLVLEKG